MGVEVGQTVYILYVQSEKNKRLYAAQITNIGRKYITVKYSAHSVLFDKGTLQQKDTVYGRGWDYKLFLTLEDYEKEVHREALIRAIHAKVYCYGWEKGISNDELRDVALALHLEEQVKAMVDKTCLTLS